MIEKSNRLEMADVFALVEQARHPKTFRAFGFQDFGPFGRLEGHSVCAVKTGGDESDVFGKMGLG